MTDNQMLWYPRRPVRFWLRTASWLLVMFVAFEALCRVFLSHAPEIRIDPHYDRITKPDQPIVQTSEGWGRGHTNELGHLDAPMPRTVPDDGILVIGDSLTEGRQVAMGERFTNRLGERLGRRVYNVGHTGWSPLNAIGFMQAELGRFKPRTVIVQISGNDLEDMGAKKRPHIASRDGAFEILWPSRAKHGLAKTITRAREAASRSALIGALIVRAMMVFSNSDEDGGAAGTCEKPDPLVVSALPWVTAQLHALHPDVRLLYLPVLDYHAGCVDKCSFARAMWEHAAALSHLPLIDATSAMCDAFRRTQQPLNGFWNTIPGVGHLNADGHEVVAGVIAHALGAPR